MIQNIPKAIPVRLSAVRSLFTLSSWKVRRKEFNKMLSDLRIFQNYDMQINCDGKMYEWFHALPLRPEKAISL